MVKIYCSKRLAFLLKDLKLISNQQQLISKTDTNDIGLNDPISATTKHNTSKLAVLMELHYCHLICSLSLSLLAASGCKVQT